MDTRQDIERVLDEAYAARQREDLEAIVACFNDDALFKINGPAPPAIERAQHRASIKGLFDAFQLLEFHLRCRVIDPPRAVVHWSGTFRSHKNGQVAEADVLDLFDIRNGGIASLTTFFDTELAARLMA